MVLGLVVWYYPNQLTKDYPTKDHRTTLVAEASQGRSLHLSG